MTVWQLSDITADRVREAAQTAELQASLTLYDHMPAGLLVVDDHRRHRSPEFDARRLARHVLAGRASTRCG